MLITTLGVIIMMYTAIGFLCFYLQDRNPLNCSTLFVFIKYNYMHFIITLFLLKWIPKINPEWRFSVVTMLPYLTAINMIQTLQNPDTSKATYISASWSSYGLSIVIIARNGGPVVTWLRWSNCLWSRPISPMSIFDGHALTCATQLCS